MRKAYLGLPAVLLLLAIPYFARGADAPDWHLTSAGARPLCSKSAWMHGYMHGYEQGFHEADLDLQLAREARDAEKIESFKAVAGYQRGFGDKELFRAGYREGFRVGYADGFTGRRFRALGVLEKAAAGLSAGAGPSKPFDEGLSTGYDTGRRQGLEEARSGVAFRQAEAQCRDSRRGDDYCDGYARGFRMGYADGYTNQAPQKVAVK